MPSMLAAASVTPAARISSRQAALEDLAKVENAPATRRTEGSVALQPVGRGSGGISDRVLGLFRRASSISAT